MGNFNVDILAKKIWDYMLMHQELKPSDAIFVLGSNDTRVALRAGELFLQGYGKYIICSGGNGKGSCLSKPEAVIFSEILIGQGVPKKKIILEPNSTNTGENILFTKNLLKEKKLDFKSFILVQKPYMERRTFATFRKQWGEVECCVTSPQILYEVYAHDEDFKSRFISTMVGDLQRIKEYPKLGFQIEQNIPDDVWKAWEGLVALGYTKWLL